MIFVKLRLILNDTSFIITVFTLLFPHKSDIQDYIYVTLLEIFSSLTYSFLSFKKLFSLWVCVFAMK